MSLFLVGSAQAIHDLSFQLDGDLSTHCYTAPNCANQVYDWGGNALGNSSSVTDQAHGLFTVTTNSGAATQTVAPNSALVPSVFAAANFQRDFESGSSCALNSSSTTACTSDDTTYATGSKDTLGIGNGGWQCNHDANVNSKIDIMNAYVASYFTGANNTGDHIFYFGLEKNKSNGTNDIGIWFLKSNAACSAPTGHVNWTGSHSDGDVLIVSEFTNGGGVSTIKAFQWAANAQFPGDKGCIDSHDNPNPGAGGCNGLPIGTGQDCKTASTGSTDVLCATTNATSTDPTSPASKPWNQTVSTPWLTWDATAGVGNSIPSPDFFEGGINITKVFQQAGNPVPSCFNVIVPDTRSSASVTATLFDYVVNRIGECSAGLTTQQNFGSAQQIGTNGTIDSGTDTAELKISGTQVWGGTLKWYLCGPDVTSCDTHGVLVDSKAVANTDNNNCGADCIYTNVKTATLTSAGGSTNPGQYCWHAQFVPNAATAAALQTSSIEDTGGATECFTVQPRTPTLSTSATCPSPCALGSTLTDTATLTGTANNPNNDGPGGDTGLYKSINGTTKKAGGTITWTLYGPNTSDGSAQCSTTKNLIPNTATVNGDGSAYSVTYSTSVLNDTPGKYTFAASYPGEAPNTTAPTNQVGCDATGNNGEQVTIVQHPTTTVTNPVDGSGATISTVIKGASVFDHAVVTDSDVGGGPPTGTVSFWYCKPSEVTLNASNNPICGSTAGTQIGSAVTLVAITGTDKAQATSTPAVTADTVGTWCFRATYTPANATFTGSSDNSTTECFNVVDVSISTAQTFTVKDSATITPSGPGATVGGTVSFSLYDNSTCSGSPIANDPSVTVPSSTSAQTVSSSTTTITVSKPTLSWLVTYTHGTGTAKDVTSTCNTENSAVTITNG